MAPKYSIGRAGEAARAARQNRYVKQIIEDEQLHANLLAAWAAAREAYGRMGNGKPATQAIFDDRKVQRSLVEAAGHLREASQALSSPPPKRRKRKGGIGRALVLVVVAGVLALALSEELRSKVLDLMFGAEEEFDYSSTTTPAEPPPAPAETDAGAEAEAPAS